MRASRRRFLTIQLDGQWRNDTCNKIFHLKITENSIIRLFAENIAPLTACPEILDLYTHCIPSAESRSNPIPRIRICESTSLRTDVYVGRR